MAFLLAHLSDPHLAPLPRPRWHELLGKRATGYVNWHRRRRHIHRSEVLARIVADLKAQAADHVAVTGDLVNVALPGEIAPARAFLEALGTPHDVTLVPGNHDAYVRGVDLDRHWGAFMRGDDGASFPLLFPFLRRRDGVALIGLSSAVATAPFMATGRIGDAQLARLGELLAHCDGSFRVVLVHHPPVSKPGRRFKRLVDGAALAAVLARHGAELVLHGHDHERASFTLPGPRAPIPVVGVPSASEAPPGEHDPAGYNLLRIDGRRCELIARGLTGDGGAVIERERRLLA